MWGYEYLVRTYIELGEIGKAKKLIDSIYELALKMRNTERISVADALRGMQFRAERKWQESIDHFEKSLKESEEINLYRRTSTIFAYYLTEYARVYLERDQEGDKERAYKLLDEALGICQKVGTKVLMEKIIAKKKLLTA